MSSHDTLARTVLPIPDQPHVDLTRRELAEFVLGRRVPASGSDALTELDGSLDRSHLMSPTDHVPTVIEPKGKEKYTDGLEH